MAAPMIENVAGKMICLKSCSAVRLHHKSLRRISTSVHVQRWNDKDNKDKKSDFRLLNIRPSEDAYLDRFEKNQRERESRKRESVVARPRFISMKTDQDWTNVWPTAKSFNWSVVPLPVRQGVVNKMSEGAGDGLPLDKKSNLELMKIPNFLHLTKKHIKKHCDAIKSFCTPWPEELKTPEDVRYHFPMEVITSDYCFSGPSVRDQRARTVTVQFKLKELELDDHAKDKYLRLVGSRYNAKTGKITLTSDRCPIKKQNFDYIQYLMTATYFESWKTEAWEQEMTEEDKVEYSWQMNNRTIKILDLLRSCRDAEQLSPDTDASARLEYLPEELTEEAVASLEPVQQYGEALEELFNTGENYATITNYKQAVMDMLNVKSKATAGGHH